MSAFDPKRTSITGARGKPSTNACEVNRTGRSVTREGKCLLRLLLLHDGKIEFYLISVRLIFTPIKFQQESVAEVAMRLAVVVFAALMTLGLVAVEIGKIEFYLISVRLIFTPIKFQQESVAEVAMRLAVVVFAALMTLGLVAFGVVVTQKNSDPLPLTAGGRV